MGFVGSSMLLLCGPLLFFYVRSVLYKQHVFTKNPGFIFLPFYCCYWQLKPVFFLQGAHANANNAGHTEPQTAFTDLSWGNFIYLHFTAYLIASLLLLKKYQKAAVNQFSNAQHITLNWLKTLVFFFFFSLYLGQSTAICYSPVRQAPILSH